MESNKLDEISKTYIDIFGKLLNNDNLSKNKEAFYNFLYADIIQIPKDIIFTDKVMSDEIDDSYNTISEYIETIYSKNDVDQNILNKYLKNTIINKKKDILKKINECDTNLLFLKKYYVNTILYKYFPSNIKEKLIFKDRNIFIIKNENLKLSLGEFFIRLLFVLTTFSLNNNSNYVKNNNFHSINDQFNINNFYKLTTINNYCSVPPSINNYIDLKNNIKCYDDESTSYFQFNRFSTISNQFKYWYLFSFSTHFFSNNIDFESLFNLNDFKKIVDYFLMKKPEIKKNKKKKKQSGGSKTYTPHNLKKKQLNKLSGLLSKKSNNYNKSNNKKTNNKKTNNKKLLEQYNKYTNIKKQIIDHFTKININFSSNVNSSSTSLYNIYIPFFIFIMSNYFNKILSIMPNTKLDINTIEFPNPFYSSKNITLKNINETEIKNTSTLSDIKSIICNKNKLSFFNTLRLFQDNKNETEILEFFKYFKLNLIIILYSLYSIKKNIYKNYIDIINEKYNLTNVVNNSTKNNKNINKNKNVSNKKKILKKEHDIVNSYKKVEKNIEKKYKNNIFEYDKKMLEYDEMVKKVLLEKYKKFNNNK